MRGAFGPFGLEFDAPGQRYATLRSLAGQVIAERIAEPFQWKYSVQIFCTTPLHTASLHLTPPTPHPPFQPQMVQLLLLAQLGVAVSRDHEEPRGRRYSHTGPHRAAPSVPSSTSSSRLRSQSSAGSMERQEQSDRGSVLESSTREDDEEASVEDLAFFGPKGTTTVAGGDADSDTPTRRIVRRIVGILDALMCARAHTHALSHCHLTRNCTHIRALSLTLTQQDTHMYTLTLTR